MSTNDNLSHADHDWLSETAGPDRTRDRDEIRIFIHGSSPSHDTHTASQA